MPSDFNIELVEQDGASARFRVEVPRDLKFFEGHFVGDPILPGVAQVLMVESATRTCWPDLGAAQALRRLKFLSAIMPEHVLELALTRDSRESAAEGKSETESIRIRFVISRDAEAVSKGSIYVSKS